MTVDSSATMGTDSVTARVTRSAIRMSFRNMSFIRSRYPDDRNPICNLSFVTSELLAPRRECGLLHSLITSFHSKRRRGYTLAPRSKDELFRRDVDAGAKSDCVDPGWRCRSATLSTHQTEGQACRSVGWQVPLDRHTRIQLHKLRHSPHLDPHSVQLGLAQ